MGISLTGWPAWQQLHRTMGCRGWRRAGSPEVSTGSGGRPQWTPAAVGVSAAPAQHLHWQDWRVSSAPQMAQQSSGMLLDFPCWLTPECPCSHPCCSSHHCPLQQGKEGSSSSLSWQLSFLSTVPCSHPSSPRTLATVPSSPVQDATFLHCSSTPQLLSYRQLCCGCPGGSFVIPGFGSVEQRWCCLFIFLPSVQKGRQGQGCNAIKLPKHLTLKTILGIRLRLLVHISPLQMLMLVGLKNPLSG